MLSPSDPVSIPTTVPVLEEPSGPKIEPKGPPSILQVGLDNTADVSMPLPVALPSIESLPGLTPNLEIDAPVLSKDDLLEHIAEVPVPSVLQEALGTLDTVRQQVAAPASVAISLKGAIASMFSQRRISDERVVFEKKAVSSFLGTNTAEAYYSGILVGLAGAALFGTFVKNLASSPMLGVGMGYLFDYMLSVSTFTGLMLFKHRQFFFDTDNPELGKERLKLWLKVIKSDLGMSSAIYGLNAGICFGTYCLSHALPTLSKLVEHAPTLAAVLSFALFVTVATRNVLSASQALKVPFRDYLSQKYGEDESKRS